MTRFWLAMFASASATLLGTALVAWVVGRALVPPPPERFMTPVFEMDLAEGWICFEDGREWICRPDPAPKDTIAIIAMKNRDDSDSMDIYEEHLRKQRVFTAPDGTEVTSQVKHVRSSRIGAYDWIDALHFESELPNYHTRYLATVTSHIGVLVTFSTHKDSTEQYNSELVDMINSLDIYQRPISAVVGNR